MFKSADMTQPAFIKLFVESYGLPSAQEELSDIKETQLGVSATIGWQKTFRIYGSSGYDLIFFCDPSFTDMSDQEGGAVGKRLVGTTFFGDDGSMLLKKVATDNERRSNFD